MLSVLLDRHNVTSRALSILVEAALRKDSVLVDVAKSAGMTPELAYSVIRIYVEEEFCESLESLAPHLIDQRMDLRAPLSAAEFKGRLVARRELNRLAFILGELQLISFVAAG